MQLTKGDDHDEVRFSAVPPLHSAHIGVLLRSFAEKATGIARTDPALQLRQPSVRRRGVPSLVPRLRTATAIPLLPQLVR